MKAADLKKILQQAIDQLDQLGDDVQVPFLIRDAGGYMGDPEELTKFKIDFAPFEDDGECLAEMHIVTG